MCNMIKAPVFSSPSDLIFVAGLLRRPFVDGAPDALQQLGNNIKQNPKLQTNSFLFVLLLCWYFAHIFELNKQRVVSSNLNKEREAKNSGKNWT